MATRYRLEALLRLRQREKKAAELKLGRALMALNEAKEELKKLEEEKIKITEREKTAHVKMSEEMGGGRAVARGQVHVNFLRKLKEDGEKKVEEIAKQKEEIEERTEKVAKAKKEYFAAIRALRVMEKHKALWAKKMALELTRREEKEMDELGQTIHSLRKWRGDKTEFQV